jgi:hypothetical protein
MAGAKETLGACYGGALQRCLEVFGQLDAGDWQQSAKPGGWTARDYLGHLVTSQETEGTPATVQSLAGQPVEIPGLSQPGDIDAFNVRNLEGVRDLSPHELIARLRSAVEEHLRLLDGVSEEDLQKPASNPGLRWPITVETTFDMYYLHLPLHYQDIRHCIRKSRSIPHWAELASPEEIHDSMDRTFRLMPLMYWPERGGDLRATYLFDLRGPGGGQWTLAIADRRATSYPGRPERADIEIRAAPALWIDLQTKSANPLLALLSRRLRLKPLRRVGLFARLERLFEIS